MEKLDRHLTSEGCSILSMAKTLSKARCAWASEASPTLTSTIESENPTRADICIYLHIFTRKWFPLQGELAPLTNNIVFSY